MSQEIQRLRADNTRKYGVSRTAELLALCGNPDKKLKCVHIAGSNGKGSCAAFISSILLKSGKRVGTFTSPEVYSYNEKFLINCRPAATKKLEKYIKEVKGLAAQMADGPTPFEMETVAALLLFASEGCDYAVVECGLGGRDDATNAIGAKEVAVITSVSLEHVRELGDTVTEICAVKSAIVKSCPLVVSAYQSEEGAAYFRSVGAIFAGEGLKIIRRSVHGQTFKWRGEAYRIKLLGSAQCYNAATAAECCRLLGVSQADIKAGLRSTTLKGRVEVINKGGATYVLDGAHNPAAFQPLLETVELLHGERRLVFGCLSDKDVEGAARLLSPRFNKITLVSPPGERAMDMQKMYKAFGGKGASLNVAHSIGGALAAADCGVVVVCGTFTVLKEAKEWIGKGQ